MLSPLTGALGPLGGAARVAAPFTPASLPNLAWWLRADLGLYQDTAGSTPVTANADPVGRWEDQSGSGRHVTQSTSGARPSYRTGVANGQPGLLFDGSNDTLILAGDDYAPTALTLYIVEVSTGDGCYAGSAYASRNNQIRIGESGANALSFYVSDPSVAQAVSSTFSVSRGSPHLVVCKWSNPGVAFWENGAAKGTGSFSRSNYRVGAIGRLASLGGLTLNGHILEFVLYSTAQSDADRALVEAYLNARYALY